MQDGAEEAQERKHKRGSTREGAQEQCRANGERGSERGAFVEVPVTCSWPDR